MEAKVEEAIRQQQWRSQGGGWPAGARPRLAQLRPRLSKLGWGPPPQYFNIGAPLKSCNGGTTPMMECIVQTHFVSNGYLYITALLLFDHCFVISQHMYSDIFSSFLLISNKCNLDKRDSLGQVQRVCIIEVSRYVDDYVMC